MALFNSVLIGKAKGKVGNVVLTSIKGQNIVKSLNDKPANPQSPLQNDNRAQMSNAVLAWQFLAMFFAYAGAISKSTESTYNAFVRIVKSGLSSTLYASRVLAAKAALALNSFVGNWFSITSVVSNAGVMSIAFNTNAVQWVNTMVLVTVQFNNDGTEYIVLHESVSENDFLFGSFDIAGSDASINNTHCYFYDTASNKITNIK